MSDNGWKTFVVCVQSLLEAIITQNKHVNLLWSSYNSISIAHCFKLNLLIDLVYKFLVKTKKVKHSG